MMGPRQVDQAALFYEFSLERPCSGRSLAEGDRPVRRCANDQKATVGRKPAGQRKSGYQKPQFCVRPLSPKPASKNLADLVANGRNELRGHEVKGSQLLKRRHGRESQCGGCYHIFGCVRE